LEGDTVQTLGYKEKYIKIKPGHFWVEGDHFENSLDSNTFGQIPLGLLTAKATNVVWPYENRRNLHSNPLRHPVKFGKNRPEIS
jgi:mitochondrial inner membrane protease subunit 2